MEKGFFSKIGHLTLIKHVLSGILIYSFLLSRGRCASVWKV